MEAFNSIVLFLLGFLILIKGAQYLIRGATSIARLFEVSHWFIGIVIVGIGTSIPELSVNIAAALEGNNIGIATIIGSNIFTLLFVLGLSALVRPIVINREWVRKDFPVGLFSVAIAAAVILLPIIGENSFAGITRGEGLLLLALFIAWLFFMLSRRQTLSEDDDDYRVFTVFASFLMIVGGIIGVFLGGQWVVDGAETIASLLGVAPGIVGLTIVGIGTALPELTVSVVALLKRTAGIAVGNVIGSNIFSFLGVFGLAALIRPLPVFEAVRFDILAALAATLVVFSALFVGRRHILSRGEGAIFLLLYVSYLVLLFLR